jgi:hypothetical protein
MLEEAEKLGSLDAAENLAVLDLQRGDARSPRLGWSTCCPSTVPGARDGGAGDAHASGD